MDPRMPQRQKNKVRVFHVSFVNVALLSDKDNVLPSSIVVPLTSVPCFIVHKGNFHPQRDCWYGPPEGSPQTDVGELAHMFYLYLVSLVPYQLFCNKVLCLPGFQEIDGFQVREPWERPVPDGFWSTQYRVLNNVQPDRSMESSCKHCAVPLFFHDFQLLGATTEAIHTDKMKGKNLYALY